ncbi:peptidase inhibitor family I36 protein [Curtobacterium sp. MCLR17_032]|uniref:peptidase inhibitor family I36 protein n=1 Tax=Curtobacterium sp. MCLR17_032 TaxID=2175650 RepID=UPI000DA7BC40|nr:peptidase inhibitor family I36 protein [Curtobacterium sp. MCLR17_032]WIE62227.1 peptidase inhibitor family I36 protein [Curtobacterium sp. MCLR17_032]
MRFKKHFASVAVVAAVASGALFTAAPASAAPAGCESGRGCTYEDANYGKGHINFFENVKDFSQVGYWVGTLHTLTDNAASSAFNNGTTGRNATWYDLKSYQGPKKTLTMGYGTTNLGYADLNDKVSSACFTGYCN